MFERGIMSKGDTRIRSKEIIRRGEKASLFGRIDQRPLSFLFM